MDNYKNNNQDATQNTKVVALEDLSRTAFEYKFPTQEDDNSESNVSTPFYTPLEFFSFEFPSPKPRLEKLPSYSEDLDASTPTDTVETGATQHFESVENSKKQITPRAFAAASGTVKQFSSTSPPIINRKIRRFSLHERRSCSPQRLLKSAASTECSGATAGFVDDKENTKPRVLDKKEDNIHILSHSGNNSPNAIIDENGSPKIFTANEGNMLSGSRFSYSPKLLASINNLNLASSPLGVISSAGYKNGNYFKFPEIDHVVQENTTTSTLDAQSEEVAGSCDNQFSNRQQKYILGNRDNASPVLPNTSTHGISRFKAASLDVENMRGQTMNVDGRGGGGVVCRSAEYESLANVGRNEFISHQTELSKLSAISSKSNYKNRNNDNNLTIWTTDAPCIQVAEMSPANSPKPKTPTIKITKEKALSLDSAAVGVAPTAAATHDNCDETDAHTLKMQADQLRQVTGPTSLRSDFPARNAADGSNRSTSLSQLTSIADLPQPCKNVSSHCFGDTTLSRVPRSRRIFESINNERLQYHHKQISFQTEAGRKYVADGDKSGVKQTLDIGDVDMLKEYEDALLVTDNSTLCAKHIQCSTSNNSSLAPTLSTARAAHKHTQLLHASNTNLKTLPECVTLVEFAVGPKESKTPIKQQSMELSSATSTQAQALAQPLTATRTKSINSPSSTNLLQRRGSNHSLTLSLHDSCSNLLGCRSGLSVSNYNLGSVTTCTAKSSCNFELNTAKTPQSVSIITPGLTTTQGAKQNLFKQHGANHSFTPPNNLAATSCGNLNAFASQNSLNVDRALAANGPGVTRTTSFITPSSNTNTTPRRGLLVRRESNQSLVLNMSNSFGGIGAEQGTLAADNLYYGDPIGIEESDSHPKMMLPGCAHHRKFFSNESLNKANTQFADLNQAHRRDSKQVCFGSVSDLKAGEFVIPTEMQQQHQAVRNHFDFPESTVCNCTGVRNISTRPLSPQATSEEFKVYLANIQMLQNASNTLNLADLIKFNYIFDNSYSSDNKNIINQTLPLLSMHSNKEAETPPGLLSTSEDCEVAARYQAVVQSVLGTVQPDENEQKRLFCDLHKEFWDLPLNHQEKPMVFGSQSKNRYKTILPNENSRVLLDKEYKEMADPITDISKQMLIAEEVPYINANYIKGHDYTSMCYIATQGPLPNTIYEFWLMIYQNVQKHIQTTDISDSSENKGGSALQQYSQKIVMLTNFVESKRQKCSVYFPVEINEIFVTTAQREVMPTTAAVTDYFNAYLQPKHEVTFAPKSHKQIATVECISAQLTEEMCQLLPTATNFFVTKNIGIVKKNGFSIRKLVVLYCINAGDDANKLLTIHKFYSYHYWYPEWPDHRSPRDINTLLDISLHILNLGKCEAEFDIYNNECISTPPQTHIEAQAVELYQQDNFNAMQPMPVIHCSAGIGRTGSLTAILNGVRQLRQSLAYSLTSMAAAATKRTAATQKLSPIDFCLPATFLEEASSDGIALNNDTDSSFTRNTLLYIRYILKKSQETGETTNNKTELEEEAMDVDTSFTSAHVSSSWQLPSFAELPKMPDILVDILGIVCNLRLQRGGMVQNSEQYELIHRAICLYLKRTFALKRF